jgi:hypothetical protein
VFAADVDGDGDVDALSASLTDDEIAWYENELGDGTSWTPRSISTAADGARSVFAADIDSDGDLDVLSASSNDNEVAWHENDLGDGTSWTTRIVDITGDSPLSVRSADMDGDGDADALASSSDDSRIVWFENELGDGTSWTPHTISTSTDNVHSVFAADVDGDGDVDAMSAAGELESIVWYPNRGGQFALPTTPLGQGVLANSQEDVALQIDLEHRGRAGDSDIEVTTIELRFENSVGAPLTSGEANALIDHLGIFLDDGSGSFGPGDSQLLLVLAETLVDGVQSLPFLTEVVAFGETKRLFVVVTMTSDAASKIPDAFELVHLIESSSAARDASTPTVPLQLEFHPDTSTGLVDTDLTSATCQAPFELDLQSFLVSTTVVCEAGTTITAGNGLTVTPTGDLTLRAGQRVRFVTDFSVQPGGELATEVDPLLEP